MNLLQLKILRKLRLTKCLHLNGQKEILGRRFSFPIRGQLGWGYLNDPEVWMSSLFEALKPYFRSNPQQCFLDVGVNLGQTLAKYRSVFPDGIYVGFEPNPACIAYVNELIELNHWDNIDLYPVGVAERHEICTLNFFHNASDDPTASIIKDFRPDQAIRRRSHIAVFPIAEASIKRPVSFLKIDVEGAELEVLKGCRSVLVRDRPIVSTEILPCYDGQNAFRIQRQQEVEALMNRVGYKCFRIAKGGSQHSKLVGLQPVESIEVHGEIELSDYLWIHEESSAKITEMILEGLRHNK
ncbi:FkbM family methyltransferase [Rhodopirellula baltica]|uniref:Methyltransferase FkbM family n=1 Tax=Rhodopirellula baltica SWK14 TaxID=993516 RepID=L7CKM0_RHOBT|nr:FkbM family methyltransferase [Rhodopirellula baltica]ELP34400.1 methyltransferase FkbM family [Rhodopirellula baltica SWK14]